LGNVPIFPCRLLQIVIRNKRSEPRHDSVIVK
jgi:hypothetical protein